MFFGRSDSDFKINSLKRFIKGLDFKIKYLPNNLVTAVSVNGCFGCFLKPLVAPGGSKYFKCFALGLTPKA